MTNKLSVGVDLDGVVFDFTSELYRLMCQDDKFREKHPIFREPKDYDMSDWFADKEDFLRIYELYTLCGGHARSKAYPDAAEALVRLSEAENVELHIVTARGTDMGAQWCSMVDTVRQLDNVNVRVDGLHFVTDKSRLPLDILIEDGPSNLNSAWRNNMITFAVDKPYNRDAHGSVRVKSLLEAAKMIVDATEEDILDWRLACPWQAEPTPQSL